MGPEPVSHSKDYVGLHNFLAGEYVPHELQVMAQAIATLHSGGTLLPFCPIGEITEGSKVCISSNIDTNEEKAEIVFSGNTLDGGLVFTDLKMQVNDPTISITQIIFDAECNPSTPIVLEYSDPNIGWTEFTYLVKTLDQIGSS